MKYQKDRNEHFHNKGKQKERVLQQKQNLEKYATENENVNIRLFMERMKINEQLSSSRTILKWICNVNDTIKKVKQILRNNMRKYFEI